MNADFFEALDQLEKERSIPRAFMLEKLQLAFAAALRNDPAVGGENVEIEIDEEEHTMQAHVLKDIVEEVEEPMMQATLEQAHAFDATLAVGDVLRIPVDTSKFGRIAAQTAKQVIMQGIREAERGIIFQAYQSKQHEILSAVVQRIDPRSGNAYLKMSDGEDTEIMLPALEQIKGEQLVEGAHIKVYVAEVRQAVKGPQIFISRNHPGIVRRLFELEVPEIADGTIEIVNLVREAGSRTKMAVRSLDANVEAVGSCVGHRGARVNRIVDELGGEKVDIFPYSDDIETYISRALLPAKVTSVEIIGEDPRSARVIVPEDQLSLAIGKEGQNARMAARLCETKIDIKAE